MMPVGNLVRMVAKNTVRSPRHFALSAFGIVIGIGAFVFFLALSLGVREVIFKVFPLDVVEVTRPRTTLGGKDVTLPITDETLAIVKQTRELLLRRQGSDVPPQRPGHRLAGDARDVQQSDRGVARPADDPRLRAVPPRSRQQ
jgi:hypothetical protein